MKLLYINIVPIDFNNYDGIPKKVLGQAKALAEFGFSVDLLTRSKGEVILYDVSQGHIKKKYVGSSKYDLYKVAKEIVSGYSCTYIRYPMSDLQFLSLLKFFHGNNIRIVVELPTYPYDQQKRKNFKKYIVDWIDKVFRCKLKCYVDRICTFSPDHEIYGIKTINTINGYDFDSVSPMDNDPKIDDCINMIAVSSMAHLHGYDRMIEGLGEYYANGGERNVVFHIVGSGPAEPEYKVLVGKLGLKEHVIFHGKLFGDKLAELYSYQSIGVNSLAIHRENLERESTLKTREYAAYGLPVISSSYVDAFSENGNERFVLRCTPDDSLINVPELISFVDGIYANCKLEFLRNEIRKNARAVCDMMITMKPIADFFHKNLD